MPDEAYKLIPYNDEDGGGYLECDNCSYPAPLAYFKEGMPRYDYKLCEICASTYLNKATTFPNQCSDIPLYKSIGWIANHLLATIRKRTS